MSKNRIPVIFENDAVAVVNKPAGTLSVPSRLGTHEKRPILKTLLEIQMNCRLWAAHRLDFEVSGLILFAKNAEAHRLANSWFEKHTIRKTYAAITEGDPSAAAAFSQPTEWRCFLVRGKKRAFEAPYGQEAVTVAQFIERDAAGGLHWRLNPLTGRGHQLRFELSRHGFPIVGDILYGAKAINQPNDAEPKSIELKAIAINFANCPGFEKLSLPLEIKLK